MFQTKREASTLQAWIGIGANGDSLRASSPSQGLLAVWREMVRLHRHGAADRASAGSSGPSVRDASSGRLADSGSAMNTQMASAVAPHETTKSESLTLMFFGGLLDQHPKTYKNKSGRHLSVTSRWYFNLNSIALDEDSEDIQALYWRSVADDITIVPPEHLTMDNIVPEHVKRAIVAMIQKKDDREAYEVETNENNTLQAALEKPGDILHDGASGGTVPAEEMQGLVIGENNFHFPEDIDTRPRRIIFSCAPPKKFDLRLMRDVVVACVELLAFYSDHRWKYYIMRFHESGWTATEMVKVIYGV
ncbi:hypothetical protein K458DRAFT_396470 [Lentithecium fluviatile CBS 122367]|uniref:Uncharacterized protein n=1 Tax=Lentithecium fluviatile CBS 122367 TaxID=1168545 RepID=A0A6G1IFS6_9PLEO|nr:hypothetical protein K458DRAFT_396470 [Lentithecium fluviatile CBS 122367]